MKPLRFLFLLPCLMVIGCLTAPPVIQEYMIINPHTVAFTKSDTVSAVSITHSCTCPFTWISKITPASAAAWIVFPADTTGDHASIQIGVLPSLMPADTNRATITIVSNNYGTDSIQVVALGPKS